MSDVSLDKILSDDPIEFESEQVSQEVEEKPEDKPEEESTGEKNDDSSPESETSEELEELKAEDQKGSTVPVSALTAERQKRQDAERRAQELEERIKGSESQEQEQAAPDIFEDQDGYKAYIDKRIDEGNFRVKIETSQAIMRSQHDDYDQKEELFLKMAKDNPDLYRQLRESPAPAAFAYKTALQHERFEQFNSFDDALKDAVAKERVVLEKQIREEVQKELKSKEQKLSDLPPSGAKGSSVADDASRIVEPSLEDILGNKPI